MDIREMACGLRKEEFWHVCADRRPSGGEDRRLWGRRQAWWCGFVEHEGVELLVRVGVQP